MYTLDSVRFYLFPDPFICLFRAIHICLFYIRAVYISEPVNILYILVTIYVCKIQDQILAFPPAVTHTQTPTYLTYLTCLTYKIISHRCQYFTANHDLNTKSPDCILTQPGDLNHYLSFFFLMWISGIATVSYVTDESSSPTLSSLSSWLFVFTSGIARLSNDMLNL